MQYFVKENSFSRLLSLMLCVVSLYCADAYSKPPEHWSSSAYAYNANNTSLNKVLQDFADSFGVKLVVSSSLSGRSDGWMRANSATEFLDRLAVKYKLNWFVYGDKLYVSPISENSIKRLDISQDGVIDLKRALKGVGLLEEKFGWGEISDEGAILISGPRQYVKLVQSLMKVNEQQVSEREEVMVFPLKHASVEDREIYIREQRAVIPGVASVLRNLLEKKRSGSNKQAGTQASAAGLDTLNEMEDAAYAKLQQSPWKSESSSARSRHGVRVEGDVRSNSILIHDEISKRQYYQELISMLDQAQSLIEIEAIIVDIDRSKLSDLGVDWQYLNNGKAVASNVSGIGANPVEQYAKGSATMLISNIGRFYASLRLLESQGEANVIANPSVLTIENQPAVIDLSETAYIETVGERVANVMPVTAGTMLRVTPRKVSDTNGDKIQLVVDIEDGRIDQSDASALPRVQRNTIATKAVIDKDYSLVVGGYHIQQRTKRTSKIPLLGDIPFIGRFFTSENKDVSHRERLFILTPHISDSRHNPQDYSKLDSESDISAHLDDINSRKLSSSLSQVEQVKSLLVHLVKEQLPKGFRLYSSTEHEFCESTSAKYDFSQGRNVKGRGIRVNVGIVQNTSDKMIDIHESDCKASGLIGVAFWPGSTLQPGEKAEVFLARTEQAPIQTQPLPSLLSAY